MELESRRSTVNTVDVHVTVGRSRKTPIGEVEIHELDGTRWWGYLATIDQIQERLAYYATTGECAEGAYFWATGLVIVRDLDPSSVEVAINDLIISGESRSALQEL